MVVYSIGDLEKLSGVKAHTIRIWEKRYNIITPRRTATNIRYYLDEDLKKVINISLLNKHGYKISKIADMDNATMMQKVAEVAAIDESFEGQLDTLTLSLIELDEAKFQKLLNKNIEAIGFEDTMLDMIYPLLDKLGLMWITGSIKTIHERFVTHMIKRKCVSEIDKCRPSIDKIFLIYLPDGEMNELSLLFLHFLIVKRGFKVINAGGDMDLYDVIEVLEIVKPDYVYTIINEMSDPTELQKYCNELSEEFRDCQVYLSGISVAHLSSNTMPDNIKLMSSSEDTVTMLEELKQKEHYDGRNAPI